MQPPRKRTLLLAVLAALVYIIFSTALRLREPPPPFFGTDFDGARAYADVEKQVAYGPRTPGSEAHRQTVNWIRAQLSEAGWVSEVQEATSGGQRVRNIIASRDGQPPLVILGAHYDSRLYADNDPDPANHSLPVPGANDGASGVAVLLELARVLPTDSVPVTLVFFDAEDNGRIEGWDWILGSRAYAASLEQLPQAVVIVDMVGDADLRLYKEAQSDPTLSDAIWRVAANLGYADVFIPEVRYTILDDHVPFLERGIPAVNIIDINYDYWHTVQDTPDKVSARSLQIVGETVLVWLKAYPAP